MAKHFSLPWRQVHLDFHTGPAIPDVGRDFDPRAFARTMKRASVASVTVFAKCHHGRLYYNTRRPERHPGLRPGLDLLGQQIQALHREGIRAPIYISVQCDEYAADTHPEWLARKPDGSIVGRTPGNWFTPGWQILDMSSPYQDYAAEQTAEVLRLFKPVDGIFFDMCWDQPSCSRHAIAGMQRAGLNPENPDHRDRYAHQVSLAYMQRFFRQVKAAAPHATIYFNSRGHANLAEEIRWQEQVEIESLPTGGWGYLFFPRHVRFARTFPKPYLGMTARFHKSWADFGGLKPYAALEYETSQMMAHGARCSIGDQLHPRGRLDNAAYELIGRAYARVAEREPWLHGARPVCDTAVLQMPAPQPKDAAAKDTLEGVTRMLTQLACQFNFVLPQADWRPYRLLVMPDSVAVDASLAKRLRAFLARGGKVLATGTSGLAADGTRVLLPELGVAARGISPYATTYIRFGKEIADCVPPADHVMYERGVRVVPARGAKALARVVEPYFERAWDHFCSHRHTPPDRLSTYAAAVQKDGLICIPYPVFAAHARHGNYPYRMLVRNCLRRLLPQPVLRLAAPTGAEAQVMRQPGRTIVHILYYSPERRAADLDLVEDIIPIFEVGLSVAIPKPPRQAYLAPHRMPLPFTYAGGRAEAVIPRVCGHEMVVFE
ncbi:MAG: beta-galactosidase [Planctomycetes bacterium]|nr:beta-galactosidase [Planctomycetota bacterium]